jgi:uncharacterized protein
MSTASQPTYGNGKICYVELPSTDIQESGDFYKNCFDWQIRQRDDGTIGFDDGVGQVSGTWRTDRKPTTDVGLLVHIMVDDIELTIKKTKAHGGTIVQEVGMDAPEITAWFRDLSGNILGLYQQR